jgi:hypothetical protein
MGGSCFVVCRQGCLHSAIAFFAHTPVAFLWWVSLVTGLGFVATVAVDRFEHEGEAYTSRLPGSSSRAYCAEKQQSDLGRLPERMTT